jgi:broad specificity phosphatase PhoE
MTTISLVRHGLVENPNQVYYGRLAGFGLAQLGRAQAAAAGRLLAAESVAAIYHSPMQRAAETAALLHAQMPAPVPLVESPLLNEIHSPYDGLTVAEMERRNWDFYSQLSTPYEFPNDVLGRVVAFFDMARRRHAGQHVVGVSHGDPIAFAILWAFGRPATAEQRQLLRDCGVAEGYPSHASISSFTWPDGAPERTVSYRYRTPPTPI